MKRSLSNQLMIALVGALMVPALAAAQGAVTIDALSPRSSIEPPPTFAPTARLADLAGKRVGIYWLGKYGGDNFFNAFEKVLKEKYPTATPVRYRGGLDIGDRMAAQVAKEVDTLVYGVGD